MAAAVAVLRKSMLSFSVMYDDGGMELTPKIPEERKTKIDVTIKTLLNGDWQFRRLVLTRDTLYIAMIGEDEVRDSIPLHEISCIEIMTNPDDLEGMNKNKFQGSTPANINRLSTTTRNCSLEFTVKDFEIDKEHAPVSVTFIHAFQIRTIPNGFNSGRVYYFQTESSETCSSCVENLRYLTDDAIHRAEKASRFRRSQNFVASIYNSNMFQALSSALIVANFATCIATAQISVTNRNTGDHESFLRFLDKLDIFFVFSFTIELVINAYAHWFIPFIQNAWSLFDVVIVSMSLIGLAPLGVPLGLLLLLRSCRVLRIFGKFKSVSQIFSALSWSVLPMANVFFIIFVFASIYAIIAVTFFADSAPEELSSFSRAFMSMFRITIGSVEWWFDYFPAVNPDQSLNWWPCFFLVTYVIIVTWVFFQVSIAVLLDNFLGASNAIKYADTLAAIERKQLSKQFKNPLDPLLLRLSKEYMNDSDLSARLQELFKVLDSDGSGDLSSMEFQVAIKKLDFTPRIFLSDSDFMAITMNKALCNTEGNLGPKEFETVMRAQLRLYAQSRLSSTSEYWATSDQDFTPLASLKQIMMELLSLKADHEVTKKELHSVVMETKEEVKHLLKLMLRGGAGNHDDTARVRSLPQKRNKSRDSHGSDGHHLKFESGSVCGDGTSGTGTIKGTKNDCSSSSLPSIESPFVPHSTLHRDRDLGHSSEETMRKPQGRERELGSDFSGALLASCHGSICLVDRENHGRAVEVFPIPPAVLCQESQGTTCSVGLGTSTALELDYVSLQENAVARAPQRKIIVGTRHAKALPIRRRTVGETNDEIRKPPGGDCQCCSAEPALQHVKFDLHCRPSRCKCRSSPRVLPIGHHDPFAHASGQDSQSYTSESAFPLNVTEMSSWACTEEKPCASGVASWKNVRRRERETSERKRSTITAGSMNPAVASLPNAPTH